jgi:hypothetical protein
MKKHASRRGKEGTTREDQSPTKKDNQKHKHPNKVVYIIGAPKWSKGYFLFMILKCPFI